MASGQKLASAAVKRRTQTPWMAWLRDKLLAADRRRVTPPAGPPTADGKGVFRDPNRYPSTQSARTQPPPCVPGGVHHRLSENYYLGRDVRRDVAPPAALYTAHGAHVDYGSPQGLSITRDLAIQVNKGPRENFGLEAPTPGFGIEWTRDNSEELKTQKFDKHLAYLERFDRFTSSK